MSRVGKNPIKLPAGVSCTINGNLVEISGKLGKLSTTIADHINVDHKNDQIIVKPQDDSKISRTLWGTTQRQISNLVHGVHEGFTVNLELSGVGYRASVQGRNLVLQLGYSHDVIFPIPEGINIKCEKPTSIAISGASKQKVGQVASEIRSHRVPEPYKGKGIIHEKEFVVRKEGKKK